MIAIDGLASFVGEFNGVDAIATLESLNRLFAEGPGVGISFAFTADRAAAVPAKLLARTSTRLMFKHVDPADFGAVGLRARDLPDFVPGRAIDAESGLVVQVGWMEELGPLV